MSGAQRVSLGLLIASFAVAVVVPSRFAVLAVPLVALFAYCYGYYEAKSGATTDDRTAVVSEEGSPR